MYFMLAFVICFLCLSSEFRSKSIYGCGDKRWVDLRFQILQSKSFQAPRNVGPLLCVFWGVCVCEGWGGVGGENQGNGLKT